MIHTAISVSKLNLNEKGVSESYLSTCQTSSTISIHKMTLAHLINMDETMKVAFK